MNNNETNNSEKQMFFKNVEELVCQNIYKQFKIIFLIFNNLFRIQIICVKFQIVHDHLVV